MGSGKSSIVIGRTPYNRTFKAASKVDGWSNLAEHIEATTTANYHFDACDPMSQSRDQE